MRDVFINIDSGAMYGCSSVITLTEVLTHPRRNGKVVLEKEYRDLLLHSRNFDLIPIDIEVADKASELRCRYNIRTPDALQISAILSAGCEAFLTNDKELKRVKELNVIVLDDYLNS